eukprot:m.35901 g.35901  ORF g.35901 m.35901 type:complete len:252 (+) comp12818_c0_seq1:170-925(+)
MAHAGTTAGGPCGAGPAVNVTSGQPAPTEATEGLCLTSDASYRFMEESHRSALEALHCEVQLLQQKNADMSFRLLLTEQISTDLAEAQVRVEALELRETQLLGALAAQPPSVEHPELNTIPTSDVKIASLQRKLDVAAELETSLRGKLKAMEIQSMHTHAAPPPRVQYTEFSPATRIPIGDGGPLVPSPPRKSPGGRGQRLRQHQLFRRASSLGIEQRVGRVSAPDPEVLVGSLPAYPEAMPPIRASATDG